MPVKKNAECTRAVRPLNAGRSKFKGSSANNRASLRTGWGFGGRRGAFPRMAPQRRRGPGRGAERAVKPRSKPPALAANAHVPHTSITAHLCLRGWVRMSTDKYGCLRSSRPAKSCRDRSFYDIHTFLRTYPFGAIGASVGRSVLRVSVPAPARAKKGAGGTSAPVLTD